MKKSTALLLTALAVPVGLTGCSDLISATREEPIAQDRGSRTVGAYVDDEIIETLSLVNLKKGSAELIASNISVTSYNGIVLLTGQAPSDRTRQEAEQVVSTVKKVRRINNEIKISGNSSAISRTNDAWLTTKVKAQLLTNSQVDGSRIKVVTDTSTVYLMGLMTQTEANRAVNIVRGIAGVEKIVKIFEYID